MSNVRVCLTREKLESLMTLAERGSRFDYSGFSDQDAISLYALRHFGFVEVYDHEFRITDRGWEWLTGLRKSPHAVIVSLAPEHPAGKPIYYETDKMIGPEDLLLVSREDFLSIFSPENLPGERVS